MGFDFDMDEIHQDLPMNVASESTGTYAHPSGVAEGTVKEITGTTRNNIRSVWIDLVNLTQDATIKVYHKIDGTTYRQYSSHLWSTSDGDGVMLEGITVNNDWKVTITSSIAEGVSRNIPYNIVYEPLE